MAGELHAGCCVDAPALHASAHHGALPSPQVSCTPGAASKFLDVALRSQLWGLHIAHASQNVLTETMYPPNFTLLVRWSEPTAALMRDWLLLSMRQVCPVIALEKEELGGARRRSSEEVGEGSRRSSEKDLGGAHMSSDDRWLPQLTADDS